LFMLHHKMQAFEQLVPDGGIAGRLVAFEDSFRRFMVPHRFRGVIRSISSFLSDSASK
jgi:hypothetical protein